MKTKCLSVFCDGRKQRRFGFSQSVSYTKKYYISILISNYNNN